MPAIPRACSLAAVLFTAACSAEPSVFRITVVDDATGRGVPLVTLETVNNIRLVTDSNGVVAFDEPGLLGQTVYVHVSSHGYEYPKDGFGYRGKALAIKAGGAAELRLHRLNVAERLYRITGAGIYRDSVLCGVPVPTREPLLNGQVLGSDSVLSAVFRGRLYWFWGDTNRPGYPLGNFHTTGATSRLPTDGGLDPERGIDLTYVVDDKGFAKGMAPLPGDGPTWLSGLTVLTDADGRERMFAGYAKIKGMLDAYQRGLVEYSVERDQFEKVCEFGLNTPGRPDGHPFRLASGGRDYVHFSTPYPLLRVPATPEALRDSARYEAFTCLTPGAAPGASTVERDAEGRIRYAWKAATAPVGPKEQAQLIKDGKLQPGEGWLQLRDIESGKPVTAHGGSVYWNEYRRRWVMIAVELFGTSVLGELWYAEADAPLGPWVFARKILTHDKYSFYNPKQHPVFDREGGRVIYFEGTYTELFSGSPEHTPRYDYNQILYRLDLADARLVLPVAVYGESRAGLPAIVLVSPPAAAPAAPRFPALFAPDRPFAGSVAVAWSAAAAGGRRLQVGATGGDAAVAFHAWPADTATPPPGTGPLYEYEPTDGDAARVYATGADLGAAYRRTPAPLCLVWLSPYAAGLGFPP